MVRRITTEQMADIAIAALSNARRLYDDAVTLRSAGRHPSAFVLAGLAADELGKHTMSTSFFARPDSDDEWKRFWKRFRTHQTKLGNTTFGHWVGDLTNLDDPPDPNVLHLRRLAATYADIESRGTVTRPDELITEAETDALLEMVRSELEFCTQTIGGVSRDQLINAMNGLKAHDPDGEGLSHVEKFGPRAAAAMGIAMRARLNDPENKGGFPQSGVELGAWLQQLADAGAFDEPTEDAANDITEGDETPGS